MLFVNTSNEEQNLIYKLDELTGIDQATVFEFQEHKNYKIGLKNIIELTLKPNQSKLYFISLDGNSPF